MDDFIDLDYEDLIDTHEILNRNDGFQEEPNVQISVVDSGAESICPRTYKHIKWKMPTSSGSQNGGENPNSPPWVVTLNIWRAAQVTAGAVSARVYFTDQNKFIHAPIQKNGQSTANADLSLVAESFTISLQPILDLCTEEEIELKLCFGQHDISSVCQFQIKELQVEIQLSEEDCQDGGTIGIRTKKQMVTGPHKGRCQRLERKDLKFFVKTNIALKEGTLRGRVKRVNDSAMLGKQKAVTGETEIPLTILQSPVQDANDPRAISYVYSVKADLDPEKFYLDHPGKELYTSDKNTPENNVFIFGIRISVGYQSLLKEVYQFKTKSKEYSNNKHQYLSAIELDANRANIKDLRIQKLVTVRGDIAYSWKLLDANTAERYDEGDVVGIFPNKTKPNDKTYLDLLTPNNYKEAILAGVITRSYYIAANSQDDDHENPCEKICMIGKVPIKVSGSVKHGDYIYASNKLPGIGVAKEQLSRGKGNLREKRNLLGYSLETNTKSEVKLVSCVVSILLSINNGQIEELLAEMEDAMTESFDRKIDEFRDDIDIKMDGMNQIVSTTQDYVVTKRRKMSRQIWWVRCSIILFFMLSILSSYFFLAPSSPYIKWKCRQGSLPGSITFNIENRDDENFVRMEGILFDVVDLRHKIGVDFPLKKNFTGSYYFNLRKCKRKNLRKVLGWFSNPPVYCRAQVFAVSCDCVDIYHYHQYHTWVKYDPVFTPQCNGDKASTCMQSNHN